MSSKNNSLLNNAMKDSEEVFADYARYYDLLYKDKDYEGEADYVAKLIKQYHPKAVSILELGSGTGIHAALLAEKDYSVHGIERSPEMLAQSLVQEKKRNAGSGKMTFTGGDIREVRLNEHFDVAIALFHVISYQTTNADVTAAFETAREHLKPGGIFIFDVWYGPAVLFERPDVRIKRIADEHTEITRLAEPVLHPNENLVDVNYNVFVRDRVTSTVKVLKETHVMRYFFKPEFEYLASQLKFDILHAEEWLTGKNLGLDTWGVCFVMLYR